MKIQSSVSLLQRITQRKEDTFEQLSSGKRINKAADDPAGLAVVAALLSEGQVLSQANRNISDARSLTNIAEGALSQVTEISTRISELATQAANGTLSDEQRLSLDQEAQALLSERDRILQSTTFNDRQVFSGESLSIQSGSGSDPGSQLSISGISPSELELDLRTTGTALAALSIVGTEISTNSQNRAELGASGSRLDVISEVNSTRIEQLGASASRINDADIASVSSRLQSDSILQRLAIESGKQANSISRLQFNTLLA